MRTRPAVVADPNNVPIPNSVALLWGNNAAWLCAACKQLLGNRTGNGDFAVACPCGARYEIQRANNRNGRPHLGRATGVRQV
jgi:hypothetical protein